MKRFAKRLFDLIFSILFLLILSPVYIIVTIIILISSPGNPFYTAKRVGLHGKIFRCYKFRSMRVDSGKVKLTTLRNDDRIYPFGRFMRKTKIDELPQVLNILFGQMSFVGPRPEDEENATKIYVGEYKKIYEAKPGLTSIASLYDFTHGEKYESEEEYEKEFLPRKLFLELYYVEHQSFWFDIKLIFKTIGTIICVVFGKDMNPPKELNNIQNNQSQQGDEEEKKEAI